MNTLSHSWTKLARLVTILMIVASLSLAVVPPAQAGEVIEGDPDATVGPDEVIEDDLFIAGNTVRVEGTVVGDLFAAGEVVIISGVVEGNLYATGGAIVLSGEVIGSAHFGGYAVTLEEGAFVGRNIYFGGFSLIAEKGSLIERSIYGGGYQVMLNGEVGRDVTAGVAAFEVNGYVNGDLKVQLGEAETNVIVGPQVFQGWVTGSGVSVQVIGPGFRVEEQNVGGEIDYQRVPFNVNVDVDVPEFVIDPGVFVANLLLRRVGEFVSLLIVGALLLFLGRDWLDKLVAEVRTNAPANAGWGLMVFLLYIPVVLLAVTLLVLLLIGVSVITLGNLTGEVLSLGGLSLGGLMAVFGILVGLVTKAVIAYVVGYWILNGLAKLTIETRWAHFGTLALGVFLYEVLYALPVFGIFFMLVVVLIGTGAIFSVLREKFRPAEAAA